MVDKLRHFADKMILIKRHQSASMDKKSADILRGHAAALAVVLGDELVEEQVDLGAGGAAAILAQGAEPGGQAAEPIILLRRRIRRRPAG